MRAPQMSLGQRGRSGQSLSANQTQPSLANHLLNKWPERFTSATQRPFLSHAGCGTLSASALSSWLVQNNHVLRAMIPFIGILIGKIPLTDTKNTFQDSNYRLLDLLISTVSNLRKELDFLNVTQSRYHLSTEQEPPKPFTKALTDLLAAAGDAKASILEGMVALWLVELCYCASWQYASTFASTIPSNSYSLPSHLSHARTFQRTPPAESSPHVNAIHECLIKNWTSLDFAKFVETCKAMVDELANVQTSGNGREELLRCETQFQQILFLWEGTWPSVSGMGEENELANSVSGAGENVVSQRPPHNIASETVAQDFNQKHDFGRDKDAAVEIQDGDSDMEDDDALSDQNASLYGGTGLGVVAAANRS